MSWSLIPWALFDGLLLCLLLHVSVRNQEHYRFAPLPAVCAVVAVALLAVNALGRLYLSAYLMFAIAPLIVLPLSIDLLVRWCWLSRMKAAVVLVVFFLIYLPFHCGREALSRQIRQTLEIRWELEEREQQRLNPVEVVPSESAAVLSMSDRWVLEVQSWSRQRIEWSDLLFRLQPLFVLPTPEAQVRRLAVSGQMSVMDEWVVRAGRFSIEVLAGGVAGAHAARIRALLEKSEPFRDLFEDVRVTMGEAEVAGGAKTVRSFTVDCRRVGVAPDPGWLRRGSLSTVLVRAAPNVLAPDAQGSFLPAARSAVVAAAAACGVDLQTTRPYALSDGAGAARFPHLLRVFTLKVEGRGSFEQIVFLLYRLEKSNPLLSVFNMTIEAVAEEPARHRVQLDVQWPVWANRAVVEKLLLADGISEIPGYLASEPPPVEYASELGDPFLPLDYSPQQKEDDELTMSREGRTEAQWLEAELELKVTGHGLGIDGEPYAIVNGELRGKGDRVSVRTGIYEYTWTVGSVSREVGVRFERLDVRIVSGPPGGQTGVAP